MNNYTEIEIGGEKRGAKLGTLILKKVCERLQITPDELFKKLITSFLKASAYSDGPK